MLPTEGVNEAGPHTPPGLGSLYLGAAALLLRCYTQTTEGSRRASDGGKHPEAGCVCVGVWVGLAEGKGRWWIDN